MSGGLLVAGTTSDAGKSVLTAGICRWLHRRGVKVAPFKAQNMSNNSAVVVGPDGRGGEIGRAQAMQAAACGLAPDIRFNPVLLKPGSDLSSQVVLLGEAIDTVTAGNYRSLRPRLAETAHTTLAELRAEYDAVICEGAGSPAEINLRAGDFVNMGLARHAGLPAIVVGDIDRGGVFAALFGTVALLSPEDLGLVSGFVINKFRIAVIRLPRISNATDAEALAAEPGVQVRLTVEPADLADADLVVIPGSKATVSDLAWLRETGLADAVHAHVATGKPLLGICGGFQMLARTIDDEVESRRGTVPGLGLLPVDIAFRERKTLARSTGSGHGAPVRGYEIHHGYVSAGAPEPLLRYADGRPEGAVAGAISGTHWHGAFESDEFRRRYLTEAARAAGRHGFTVAPDTRFAEVRERALDVLGDLVEEHLDTDALWRLIEAGSPAGLPFIPPGAPA
jgi:adenosylcobyric acid synthase